jgi:2-oxoglutarate ferredoxin oxidoreductase subunit beta
MSVAVEKLNRLGLSREDYKGAHTTLCAGCGHNSITNHIVKALYDSGVEPHLLAKMSGIGCSSKAAAYFVEHAHGFNGAHGRMPSIATGAKLANRDLVVFGISGDGDTASIGLGQYCHMIRRNLDMTYIVEDNGVYGLTKGQFSATADLGSRPKRGGANRYEQIDVCALAIELGASFVARSFSGDGKQLVPLIQAGLAHRGTAVLDVISPCVTFNDHEGSTKSYAYVKDHDAPVNSPDYIAPQEEITVDYEPGTVQAVQLHGGSHILLRKISPDHDARDPIAAMRLLFEARHSGEILTGLLYVNPDADDLCARESLPSRPLAALPIEDLRPSREQWDALMAALA